MAYFQGELHLRGRFIPGGVAFMSALRLTWWVPLSTRGRSCITHLPLHLGVSGVRFWKNFFLVTRESWVCTHMVERCILWGDAFWVSLVWVVLSFCMLIHRLCWAFASFWRSRCVLPLHDCVEPCLFLEGSCFVWSTVLSSFPCLRGPIFGVAFFLTQMTFSCFCLALGHLIELSSFLLLWLPFHVSRLVLVCFCFVFVSLHLDAGAGS